MNDRNIRLSRHRPPKPLRTRATSTRDRVREVIRAEVARAEPVDDARGPLELIVETSLRYSETGGLETVTVVDEKGEPRTAMRQGQAVAMTVQDLVEELRVQHPTLFKPRGGEGSKPAAGEGERHDAAEPALPPERTAPVTAESAAEAGDGVPADGAPPEPGGPERDWLDIASPSSAAGPGDRWPRRAGHAGGERRDAAQGLVVRSPEDAPGALGSFRTRAPQVLQVLRSRVLGAVLAVLLLVGIGTLAVSRLIPATEPGPEAVSGSETASPTSEQAAAGEAAQVRQPGATAEAGAVSIRDPDATVPGGAVSIGDPDARAAGGAVSIEEPDATATAGLPDGSGPLRGIPEVLDTSTLWLQNKVVRLFGVEWARGGAAEELTQYLRGREVACEPSPSSETYRCKVGGQDLSKVVLFNGGGRATAEATPELKAAEEHARSARLGVWDR
jgi:endonuclease YncB( thermonuclease family)